MPHEPRPSLLRPSLATPRLNAADSHAPRDATSVMNVRSRRTDTRRRGLALVARWTKGASVGSHGAVLPLTAGPPSCLSSARVTEWSPGPARRHGCFDTTSPRRKKAGICSQFSADLLRPRRGRLRHPTASIIRTKLVKQEAQFSLLFTVFALCTF